MYSFKKRYQTKKKNNDQSYHKKISLGANQNSQLKQANCLKRGKRQLSKLRLVFRFASDWLKQWREFFGPIEKKSEDKPIQYWIIFALVLPLTSWEDGNMDHF